MASEKILSSPSVNAVHRNMRILEKDHEIKIIKNMVALQQFI